MVLSITDDIFVDFGPPSDGFGCIVTELILPCTGSAESRRKLLTVIRFVLIFVWDVTDNCAKVNVQHAVVVSFLQHLKRSVAPTRSASSALSGWYFSESDL
jgi:hypothetical protein